MKRQRGFSLIELMVGMAIGLLCTLVIAGVLSLAEGRRRGSSAGTDAQISGSVALYQVQRELAGAGYGFASEPRAVGCNLTATLNGAAATHATNEALLPERLVPVRITQGANGASDRLRVLASSKGINLNDSAATVASLSVPARVIETFVKGGQQIRVNSVVGFRRDDLVAAVQHVDGAAPADINCYLARISDDVPLGRLPIATNAAGWNPADHPENLPLLSFVVNLGQIRDVVFSIDGARQLVASQLNTAASPMTRVSRVVQGGIVLFKAMYGIDSDGDGGIDTFTYTTPLTKAAWENVLAVRVAVVARSAQYEREDVTTTNPMWRFGGGEAVDGSVPCGNARCVTLALEGLPDWRRYRYRVYETLVPLRNQRLRTGAPACVGAGCP